MSNKFFSFRFRLPDSASDFSFLFQLPKPERKLTFYLDHDRKNLK